jgi:hypothetical protein
LCDQLHSHCGPNDMTFTCAFALPIGKTVK